MHVQSDGRGEVSSDKMEVNCERAELPPDKYWMKDRRMVLQRTKEVVSKGMNSTP